MTLQQALRLKAVVDSMPPVGLCVWFLFATVVGGGTAKTLGGTFSGRVAWLFLALSIVFLLLGNIRFITGSLLKKQLREYTPLFRETFEICERISDPDERLIAQKVITAKLSPLAQLLDAAYRKENDGRADLKNLVVKTAQEAERSINGLRALRDESSAAKWNFWSHRDLAALFGYEALKSYKDYLPKQSGIY